MFDRVATWLKRHPPRGEDCFFWFLVLCQLAPVWSYRYLPTQDGPAHLANAVILRDWGSAGSRYHEVYEIHWEPLPNWTVHLLLAGLMQFLPALAAEKVVVSHYIAGLAFSFRYFLGALRGSAGYLAAAGLLLLFPRCLWMGFYNYCLSLVLLWLILGQLFDPSPRAGDLAKVAVVLCAGCFVAGLFSALWPARSPVQSERETQAVPRWPIAVLGLAFGLLYLLVPDQLPAGHGGFLKCRVAPVIALLLLASCGPASRPIIRRLLWAATLVALSWNLGLVTGHIPCPAPMSPAAVNSTGKYAVSASLARGGRRL